ncbi:integrase [Vagococcus vulneris]|uniref:Integrase n=1 Tax=Vagococcus vulneris TaxID=1977869 RepID=A0A429ZTE3_9ENTE|nr:integrase [Vagococcus vulneris]RST96958.1 integrase [Vagococcus vulneris]
MENWRWGRCESALRDYNDIDTYIKKIEEEIRVPYHEPDLNADIKGTRTDSDMMFDTMWTIQTHDAINQLRRKKQVITELLNECDDDTEIIIRELYLKKWPRFTLNGLVDQQIISCGRNKAIKLRRKFFEELDRELEIKTKVKL